MNANNRTLPHVTHDRKTTAKRLRLEITRTEGEHLYQVLKPASRAEFRALCGEASISMSDAVRGDDKRFVGTNGRERIISVLNHVIEG